MAKVRNPHLPLFCVQSMATWQSEKVEPTPFPYSEYADEYAEYVKQYAEDAKEYT